MHLSFSKKTLHNYPLTFSTLYLQTLFLVILVFGPALGQAQVPALDYHRADSVSEFGNLVFNGYIQPTWIEDTYNFWYDVRTREGRIFYLVDAEKNEKRKAFDHKRLCEELAKLGNGNYLPNELPLHNVVFNKELTKLAFVADSVRYSLNLENYTLTKTGPFRPASREQRHWGITDDETNCEPVVSPDSCWVAFIKNYNVHIKSRETGREYPLSFDGGSGDYYSCYIRWAPNSEYLAVNRIRPKTKNYIYLIEAAPEDQLQPKLHELEYNNPGDALQIRRPALFSVLEKRKIPITTNSFEHQYRLSLPDWRDDSRAFTFEYNQRGHQVYQVLEVLASDGSVNVLINERSNTFFDYNGKKFRHDVDDGKEIIWASERDGWNHLYLFDGQTGKLKNQITKGEWVVRGVEYVNESLRYLIFRGAGRYPGEDPYLVRYYRVNFDGSNLLELTPEYANHHASFSHDYAYFTDTYSRIDEPPVTILRRTADGKILMILEKADISDLLAVGWIAPEVFTAKGRDGETDIWGIIHRPTHFDPSKSYPVIELIYAGPHSAHVPKSFNPFFQNFSGLSELGFIIVRIDGMGTSHRSKAFHDICYQNLKDAGFPDRILWIKAAAARYDYMDIQNVGIFGRSAGGQNAMGALLFHPDFYKAAVASVGNHDNRVTKMWWPELWMGYPVGPHYQESSNVLNAHKLQGKLMLTVGALDENVNPAITMQVVDALIKAGKEFELLVFPSNGHESGGVYEERRRRDFFVRHLLRQEPPDWNRIITPKD